MSDFSKTTKIVKADEDLGIVFGWGITCTIDGEPHYDLQGDHVTEGGMLKAVTEFMLEGPDLGEMHKETGKGTVLFSFPLTAEIAKAYGIECDKTGWLVGVKPSDPELLAKFKDGTYTGFSIGGTYGETTQVDD